MVLTYVPVGLGMQEGEPAELLYVPVGHCTQEDLSELLVCPAAQRVGAEAPAVLYEPAGVVKHPVAPSLF